MELYKTINIDKTMYNRKGKSFSQVLEELDPSENYGSSPLGKLDAFGRQLKRFDIKVSGADSDMPDITASVTNIEGMDYRSIVSAPEDGSKELKVVNEGAFLPVTTVKTQENLVKLIKRGRMLVSTYEALRFQRLDLFTVTLKQIGSYISRTQLGDAVEVLLNGDGNNNAATVVNAAQSGTLAYGDLISLWSSMSPYELNTLLVPTALMEKILAMPEMQDAQAGLDFHGTGKMITPMGAKLIHVPSLDSDKIIGLDNKCALEMVQAGQVTVDYDKLIDRQLERAAVSVISGFAKIFSEASVVLKV